MRSFENIAKIPLKKYPDDRGEFRFIFESTDFKNAIDFNQLLHVASKENVFRGMHIQLGEHSQKKIFTVLSGSVIDFTIDLRKDSSTFMKESVYHISASSEYSLYIPSGFAHGYFVTSKTCVVQYAIDKAHHADSYLSIAYDDNKLSLGNHFKFEEALISEKDRNGISINEYLEKI